MKKCITLLLFICVTLQFSSCVPEESKEVIPPEYENKQKPENNNLILSESYFGNEINDNRLRLVESSPSNSLYVIGTLNSSQASTTVNVQGNESLGYFDATLLKFDNSGNKLWEKKPGFSIVRQIVLPAGTLSNKEFILVSGYDLNGNNPSNSKRNRIMLFDETGKFISNFSHNFELYMNDMVLVENNSEFIKILIVGSDYINDKRYPAYSFIKILKSSSEFYDFEITRMISPTWETVGFANVCTTPLNSQTKLRKQNCNFATWKRKNLTGRIK